MMFQHSRGHETSRQHKANQSPNEHDYNSLFSGSKNQARGRRNVIFEDSVENQEAI